MRNLLAIGLVLLSASPALASPWVVNTEKSSLTFSGQQKQDRFTGSFGKFQAEIEFSEAAPEKGHIHVLVDIASVTASEKDPRDALPTADWLDAKTFPHAEFTSTAITRTGPHQFAAHGTLNLHGIRKEITLPFTLTPEGTATRAQGSVVLARNDYKIGQGQWASDAWIAYPVTVEFTIIASPR